MCRPRAQVGQKGISQTVLATCIDVILKRQFVRVRLGEGCGLERKETAEALSRLLDSVVVIQVGFTITFYRQPGLPRPSNLPVPVQAEMTSGEGAQGHAGAGSGSADKGARGVGSDRKQTGRRARVPKAQTDAPAEFQVVS